MEHIQQTQQFKNYREMAKNSPHFQQGVKDFKEGKVKQHTMDYSWVKQLVTQREWDSQYKYNSSYCNLGKAGGIEDKDGKMKGGKVKIGFLIIGNSIPQDCEPCTDDELRTMDLYRQARHIHPFVFKEVE